MGLLKIWVHVVWATKYRQPLLIAEKRPVIFQHMRNNAHAKGINLDFINGYTDHVHCLIALGPAQTIDNVVMLIKGESSWWINKNQVLRENFKWQTSYYAVSVDEWGVNRVRKYIKNQEEHHKKKTFEEESKKTIRIYGLQDLPSD